LNDSSGVLRTTPERTHVRTVHLQSLLLRYNYSTSTTYLQKWRFPDSPCTQEQEYISILEWLIWGAENHAWTYTCTYSAFTKFIVTLQLQH